MLFKKKLQAQGQGHEFTWNLSLEDQGGTKTNVPELTKKKPRSRIKLGIRNTPPENNK